MADLPQQGQKAYQEKAFIPSMRSRLKQMLGSDLCASIITLRCSFLFQRSPPPSILEKIVPAGLCTVNPDLPSAAGWMQFAVLFHGLAPLRLGLRQRLADIHPAVGTKVAHLPMTVSTNSSPSRSAYPVSWAFPWALSLQMCCSNSNTTGGSPSSESVRASRTQTTTVLFSLLSLLSLG